MRVEAPARAALGDVVRVAVTVENPCDEPIFVELLSCDRSPLLAPARVKALRTSEGGLAVDGVFEMEDLGPQARLPGPPRWSFTGDEPVVSPAVLAPGGTLRRELDVRAGGLRTEAVLSWRPIPAGTEVWKVAGFRASRVDAAPPSNGQARWIPVERATVALERAAKIETATEPAMAPGSPDAPQMLLFPYVLRRATCDALPRREARGEARVAVERPAFDEPAARARCGIAGGGTAVYFPTGKAWLLEGEGKRCLVSAEKSVEFKGRGRELVEALDEREPVTVTLLSGRIIGMESGWDRSFTTRGLDPYIQTTKGGGTALVLDLRRADLFAFLEALHEKDLGLDGLQIR